MDGQLVVFDTVSEDLADQASEYDLKIARLDGKVEQAAKQSRENSGTLLVHGHALRNIADEVHATRSRVANLELSEALATDRLEEIHQILDKRLPDLGDANEWRDTDE